MDATENHSDLLTKAMQHLDQAYADEETENFERALRECELAIQIAPDLAEAHNLRGIALEELGRKEEAIAAYREAVRLNPSFQEAKENLSEIEGEIGMEVKVKLGDESEAALAASWAWTDPVGVYRLSIDTPENVAFDYEVAGIGSRFLAALVDTLLIIILQAIVYITLILLAGSLFGNTQDWETDWLIWLFAVFGLIAFAFLWGYYVFFEVLWNGQSPGKRWIGLRVIRTDGTPITLTESLIRNLVRLVDFLPAYYGVGIVTMFINEQARRLGDLAAGTLVVHDRVPFTLEGLATAMTVSAPTRSVTAAGVNFPVERLTNRDIQMAEDFLRRQYQLSTPSVIARRIAHALLKRMDVPVSQMGEMSAQDLILRIVQASRNREAE